MQSWQSHYLVGLRRLPLPFFGLCIERNLKSCKSASTRKIREPYDRLRRGSSSMVEVAVSLAAFVAVLGVAGQWEWGDGRSNCSAAAAEEPHESAELAFVRVANISKFR